MERTNKSWNAPRWPPALHTLPTMALELILPHAAESAGARTGWFCVQIQLRPEAAELVQHLMELGLHPLRGGRYVLRKWKRPLMLKIKEICEDNIGRRGKKVRVREWGSIEYPPDRTYLEPRSQYFFGPFLESFRKEALKPITSLCFISNHSLPLQFLPNWPSCCFRNIPSTFLPQGLCTSLLFRQTENSSSKYSNGSLSFHLDVSNDISSKMLSLTFLSRTVFIRLYLF